MFVFKSLQMSKRFFFFGGGTLLILMNISIEIQEQKQEFRIAQELNLELWACT